MLAIRSRNRIDWVTLTRACADADIVVADRWLPKGCTPRWLKLDRKGLEQTGGVAIYLGEDPRLETVAERIALHPWREVPLAARPIRPSARPPVRSPRDR